MRWFRLYTDILDDAKLANVSDKTGWMLILMLARACELEKNGALDLEIGALSWRLRRTIGEVELAIQELQALGILSKTKPTRFLKWLERQRQSDHSNERVRRHRVTEENCYGNGNDPLLKRNCNGLEKTRLEKTREDKTIPPIPPKPERAKKSPKASEPPPWFQEFWESYPRKEAKLAAEKAALKAELSGPDVARMMDRLKAQKRSDPWIESLRENGGKFIPLAATYLNGRRWEDQTAEDIQKETRKAEEEAYARKHPEIF